MASPLLAALRSPLRPTAPAPTGTTAPIARRTGTGGRDPDRARWCLLALLAGTAVDDLTAAAV